MKCITPKSASPINLFFKEFQSMASASDDRPTVSPINQIKQKYEYFLKKKKRSMIPLSRLKTKWGSLS